MSAKRTVAYFGLLLPSLLLSAILWQVVAVGRLYYCSDSVPLLDFVPPFVHSGVGVHDHFIAAGPVVYGLWSLFIAGALGLPALLMFVFQTLRAERERLKLLERTTGSDERQG